MRYMVQDVFFSGPAENVLSVEDCKNKKKRESEANFHPVLWVWLIVKKCTEYTNLIFQINDTSLSEGVSLTRCSLL